MSAERWRPGLSAEFIAALRRHCGDIAISLALFVITSLGAGRVWRFAFDDEIYSLHAVERLSLGRLLTVYSTGHDVHPPLAYMLTGVLHAVGVGEAGMRLVGLALTAAALALFQALALMLAARRGAVTPLTRAVAVLLFGLNALAVSQGDALRWYPLFAAEIAVAVTLYVAAANDAARLASAVALGLAASTNFLAALVIVPLGIHRYLLARQFVWRLDIVLWLLVLAFGCLGVTASVALFAAHSGLVGPQISNGVIAAAGLDALGFFGGHALGIGLAWMIVPPLAVALMAVIGVIDRKAPADPTHLLVLMLVAVLAMPLVGFAKPRSFLYLAPMMAAVQVLYVDRIGRRSTGIALLLTVMVVAPAVAAIANVAATTHPFKRNAVAPFAEIVAVIDANANGKTLVVSTDPVLAWVLSHERARPERCVSLFVTNRDCLADPGSYRTVVVVSGYHRWSENPAFTGRFAAALGPVLAGRRKVASVPEGFDADAPLKARLSGTPLPTAILTVDVYR